MTKAEMKKQHWACCQTSFTSLMLLSMMWHLRKGAGRDCPIPPPQHPLDMVLLTGVSLVPAVFSAHQTLDDIT